MARFEIYRDATVYRWQLRDNEDTITAVATTDHPSPGAARYAAERFQALVAGSRLDIVDLTGSERRDVVRWMANGDHPDDRVGEIETDPVSGEPYARLEGAVVRFFRHPDVPGHEKHIMCGRTFHDHGWIDEGDNGRMVCPGDYVITTPEGRHYPWREPENPV